MKERPILFSAEMVRAILDGRKTMTRRVIKPQPISIKRHSDFGKPNLTPTDKVLSEYFFADYGSMYKALYCPYGKVGDRLYVKEDIFIHTSGWNNGTQISYQATNTLTRFDFDIEYNRSYRPAMLMNKKFTRIWLEITGIRVERVQEITKADAKKEGAKNILAFSELWDKINSVRGYGWYSNPFCWCIEFKRIK